MTLKKLGWNSFFEDQWKNIDQSNLVRARIVNEERGRYRLETADDSLWGELSGSFRYTAKRRVELPAVGDFVGCTPQPGSDLAIVHHLFNRQSCLKRRMVSNENEEQVLASNVQTVFIVTSATMELNIRRIERFLTASWNSGATPVILLNKIDLAEDLDQVLKDLKAVAQGAAIHPISALNEEGLDVMPGYFKNNQTAVVLGSSGVGKTTFVNYLMGYDALDTQEVRDSDAYGRHTTTTRDLVHLPKGGMIIDTPGMKEMGLLDQEEAVSDLFEDIEALIVQCKYSNCQHDTEPGCRIKSAIETGELEQARLASYYKLQREIQYQKTKIDKNAAAEAKNKVKKIHRSLRASKERKGR